MLTTYFKFAVNNNMTATIDVTIRHRCWKFDSSGSIVWQAEQVETKTTINPSATNWSLFSAQNNTTDKWLGLEMTVQVLPSAALTGTLIVQILKPTADDAAYPTSGYGEYVGAITYATSSASTRIVNMTID